MAEKISKQIAVYKTHNALLEMNNCLKPAAKDMPWHIHAEGEDGAYSLIRLVAVDYSEKERKKSVSVYANLKPEDVKFLYMRLCFGFEEVQFREQKIFRNEEKGGIVTVLTIRRSVEAANGKVRDYPWTVKIGNGTGRVRYNKNGGQYCEKGSYVEEKSVSVHLNDMDFFRLLSRTCTVIQAFEQKELYREREVRNFQTLYRLLKKELGKKGESAENGDFSERRAA